MYRRSNVSRWRELTSDHIAYLAFVPVLVAYFAAISRFAVNIPNADDFDMLLSFLLDFLRGHSVADWAAALFARHGEHFVVSSRLSALICYLVLGQLNFRWIILLGNTAVPLSALLLVRIARRSGLAAAAAMPAGLILLQPQFYQVSIWASGAVEDLWIMPLALGAFLCAERHPSSSVWDCLALFLGLAAVFTQGNGLFVPLLIGQIFLARGRTTWGCLSLCLAACTGLLHFSQLGGRHLDVSVRDYLLYALSFLGAPIGPTFPLAVAIGGLVAGFTLAALYFKLHRSDPALFAVIAFVELTACANALARIQFGVEYAYSQSRYTFPALFGLATVYLGYLRVGRNSHIRKMVEALAWLVAASGILCAYVRYLPDMALVRNAVEESALRWNLSESQLEYPDDQRATGLLRAALLRGIYRMPDPSLARFHSSVSRIDQPSQEQATVVARMEHVVKGADMTLLSGYAFPRRSVSREKPSIASLILRSDSLALEVSVLSGPRPDVARHYKRAEAAECGFLAVIDRVELPAGLYEAYPVLRLGNHIVLGKRIKRIVF